MYLKLPSSISATEIAIIGHPGNDNKIMKEKLVLIFIEGIDTFIVLPSNLLVLSCC